MRLKGGKVLLDLTGHGNVNDLAQSKIIQLNSEVTKAICEKGLELLIYFNDVKILFPFVVSASNGTQFTSTPINDAFSFTIETQSNTLTIDVF